MVMSDPSPLEGLEYPVLDSADPGPQLPDGWAWDPEPSGAWVPLDRLFGVRVVPAGAAVVIALALDRMRARGEIGTDNAWQAVEYWAADYLSGADFPDVSKQTAAPEALAPEP